MLGEVVRVADVSLLALKGEIRGRELQLLLDSGASCNFVSLRVLENLKIKLEEAKPQQVKLADGTVLRTQGQVQLKVVFGALTYVGTFFVLQEAIPTILGMSFFRDWQPEVSWREKRVHVEHAGMKYELPVVQFSKKSVNSVVKSWPGAAVRFANTFEGLTVDDENDDDDAQLLSDGDVSIPVVAQDQVEVVIEAESSKGAVARVGGCAQGQCVAQGVQMSRYGGLQDGHSSAGSRKPNGLVGSTGVRRAHSPRPSKGDSGMHVQSPELPTIERKVCGNCGKKLSGQQNEQCNRCANSSFKHLKNQLRDCNGSEVSINDVAQTEQVADVASDVELVPLKQFVRAGKRGHYKFFGVCQIDNDTVDESVHLNFTHRHAHGGEGDADVAHGKFESLAEKELSRLKKQFPSVFEDPVYPVKRDSMQFEHAIPLKDENCVPPKRRLYPLDAVELQELKKQISELLESNRIEPSNGPYGAPILFAKKKDGRLRMCIDYRLLNAQTRNDCFPLPRIDELLSRLDGAKVFSKLDLRDGYHQVPMAEQDKEKTAFTCRYGTFQFTVMPFGLMTAPSTFQRMMNQIFFDLLDKGVVIYLDDLLIYSRDLASHRKLLDKVFTLLAKHKLYLKDSKCHLYLERVNFLGHVVDANGVSVESGKIDCVKNWPMPINVNQVQQFLGLCNYYRKFVLRFSEIAGPLTLLTRKGQAFVWGDAQQKSFDALKTCLCSAPTLKIFDSSLKTRVVCDASNVCCGAVLEQQDAETSAWHPVEYYSKRLSQAERNYSATDREFVAIRLALERWRHYLIGQHFVILTDHAALTYLQSSAGVHRRNVRWLEFLSQFDFEIQHIKGKENVVADTLSRVPGSELLTTTELCSQLCTLNITHVDDLPAKLSPSKVVDIDSNISFLNGIISINERESFRDQLIEEQQNSNSAWFADVCRSAKNGSSMFQYRNGLLCKLVGDHFCPVVPSPKSSTIRVILSDLHSSGLGGHLGRKKLLASVKSRFYWQNMYQSVDKFCRECVVCQQNKTSTQKPVGKLQPLENPDRCFDHISMDFVVNLPESHGFDGIFTIVDRFSRLVRFIPIRSDVSASDVGRLFFDNWLCKYGVPSKIISDRDQRFQSAFWQSLCKCLDSRVAMSTAYHPQTDGLTERYHRTIEQLLRCYCSSQQSTWSEYISQCEFAINASVADAHKMSPFEVVYGFTPTLPLDTSFELKSHSAQQLVAARASVHSQVASQLASSATKMKDQADGHRRDTVISVGDKVWLSTSNLPLRLGTRKLAEKWTGPFPVIEQIGQEAFRLDLPGTWKVHTVFHSSQLKPVLGRPRVREPVALDDAEEAEFEVEAIVGERTVRGQKQYLIRWRGFGQFDDTWEPLGNLGNAKQKLAEWDRKQSRGKSRRS